MTTTSPNNSVVFKVEGFYRTDLDYAGLPAFLRVTASVEDAETAAAIAERFPGYLRLRGTACVRHEPDGRPVYYGIVTFTARLAATGASGEVNEKGISRYRKLREIGDRLGFRFEYRNAPRTSNAYPDEAALTHALDNPTTPYIRGAV